MINAEQIRAARAYLDWSTADLAQQAGLTVNGINKIEREYVKPQKDTLHAIQKVFEQAGLEFLPNSGVKKKDQIVHIWEDEEACNRLLDDVFNELRDTGGEVLISGVVESRSTGSIGKEKLSSHLARLARYGIKERLLIKEGDTNYIAPIEAYHWVPERYFSSNSFYIYGKKLALALWDSPQKVIIINDERFADSVSKLFNFVWDHTKPARIVQA